MIETGWLIEHRIHAGPAWWNGSPAWSWTTDANDAVRFSRKIDAERTATYIGYNADLVFVTEHSWG